jgi:UDP-2-acetamido-3-amino-2,3-dideoxy-glucuronate N-acetyltransferase
MNFYQHETSIIDEGSSSGEGCKIWHFTHIMKATLGTHCILGQNVFVASHVVLGNHVKVQNNVSLYEGVVCEDDVFIGPSAVFTNVINPRSFIERKNEYKKTLVKRGATVGANATVICGVTIGRYAFIGAGSVVTKDVKDFALVTGNPARQTGWMSKAGMKLQFDERGIAFCQDSQSTYKLENDKVTETETLNP